MFLLHVLFPGAIGGRGVMSHVCWSLHLGVPGEEVAPAWQGEMGNLSECKHMQITSRRFLYNSIIGYPLIWQNADRCQPQVRLGFPGLHSRGRECLSDDER
jgi:hypothetical protein